MRFLIVLLLAVNVANAAAPKVPEGYRVETIEIPKGITLGVGGLSFTAKNELMICTREGEVWRYNPSNNSWLLYADGLHEPLGIYADKTSGDIFVVQRGEFTKLVDTDNDGKADLYQTVTSAWGLTDNYHEYAFGLVRDNDGNFYGTLNTTLSFTGWSGHPRWDIGRVHDSKMGRAAKYRGWSFKITPAGEFIPWSSGMRSPAGIGMNSKGEIFYTDNQGDWNATSSLHHIKKGRFHGHPSSLMDHPDFKGEDLNKISLEDYDKMRALPVVWFPHGELASSPGEPVFDETGGKFGPFQNQIFVGDQTRSNLMRVQTEEVGGEYQGVVFNFIDPLQSGCIRNIFAADGSLWVGQTGRGWRSVGDKLFGLQRIVWDEKTVPLEMHSVSLIKNGFRIRFTKPLNQPLTSENLQVKSWAYKYQADYGSPKLNQKTHTLESIELSADKTEVTFTTDLTPRKVYQITLKNLPIINPNAWYTVNNTR